MTHFAAPSFWTEYARLPKRIQKLADNAFTRLKENPQHPSLQFKQVGRYWSARINIDYRVVAVKAPDGWVWFWIGSHAEYDRLIDKNFFHALVKTATHRFSPLSAKGGWGSGAFAPYPHAFDIRKKTTQSLK